MKALRTMTLKARVSSLGHANIPNVDITKQKKTQNKTHVSVASVRSKMRVVTFDLSTSVCAPVHGSDGRQGPALTWITHRVNGHSVVGFAGAQACKHILDPPQLLPQLRLLLLHSSTELKNFG